MAVPAWPYTAGQRRAGGSVPPGPPRTTDRFGSVNDPAPAPPAGLAIRRSRPMQGRTPPRSFGHGGPPPPPPRAPPRRPVAPGLAATLIPLPRTVGAQPVRESPAAPPDDAWRT